MQRLEDKVAFITGGARGQGRALAEKFASEGADIVISDLCEELPTTQYDGSTRDDLEQTRQLVEDQGRRCIAEVADVRDLAALEALAQRAVDELGKIDILCANAGIAAWVPFPELDEQQFREMMDINVVGAFLTAKAVAPHMIERRSGSIVLTSSLNGIEPAMGLTHYVASKAAVLGLMKNLAFELGPHGIRVNATMPGAINTTMGNNPTVRALMFGKEESTEEDYLVATRNWHVLRNLPGMPPSVIANAAMWLVSDEARTVTGVALPVDGGHLILPGFNHDAVVEELPAAYEVGASGASLVA